MLPASPMGPSAGGTGRQNGIGNSGLPKPVTWCCCLMQPDSDVNRTGGRGVSGSRTANKDDASQVR